jgi:hypothetical protein
MKTGLVVIAAAALLSSCTPSREGTREGTARGSQDPLGSYEADFRPSDHDTLAPPAVHAGPPPFRQNRDTTGGGSFSTPDADGELVQGFRVQIFATTDIDQAKAKKSEAESDFPSEWFYLQYDPPTYKIRGGNFLQRYEAERFVRLAAEKGFTNSWAVPEKVFKQQPPPQR